MMRFSPNIPDEWNCRIIGLLIVSDDPHDLSQDMLEVIMPNGISIDAGWSNDMDPNGHYVISITRGLDDVVQPIETDSPEDAILEIERLIDTLR